MARDPVERVDQRTPTAKVFDEGGSTRRVVMGMAVAHVPDDPIAFNEGRITAWSEADPTIEGDEKSGFTVRNTWYAITIRPDAIAYTYTSKRLGTAVFRLTALEQKPIETLSPVYTPVVNGNTVSFEDVVPGLSIDIVCGVDRVGINKRLADPSAPHVFTWELLADKQTTFGINWQTAGLDNYDKHDTSRTTARQRFDLIMQTAVAPPVDLGDGLILTRAVETCTRQVLAIDPVTRIKSPSSAVIYPLWIDVDLIENIASGADDGNESTNNHYWVFRASATYGESMKRYTGDTRTNLPGWRFANVLVPRGAVIVSATLKVHVSYVAGGGPTGLVYADIAPDAAAWADYVSLPSLIAKSVSSATLAATSTGTKSLDVTAAIQQVVNQAGWVSGNHMRLAVTSITSAAGSARYAYLDDSTATNNIAAELDITYTILVPRPPGGHRPAPFAPGAARR